MPIGIISAMKEEIQTLLDELDLKSTHEIGKRVYYKGFLFNQEVVLVFSRWGKVASATTVTQMINDEKIEQILFTGVAGSLSRDIHIGDMVISRELYQHDMNASPILPKLEIPLLKRKSFESDESMRLKLIEAGHAFATTYKSYVSEAQMARFNLKIPRIHCGDIASGDQFINSKMQSEQIIRDIPGVVCVEMEGAAVAQVCYEYNVPFAVIRTISDESNNNAHIDFPRFANEIASKYALGLIKSYFDLIKA